MTKILLKSQFVVDFFTQMPNSVQILWAPLSQWSVFFVCQHFCICFNFAESSIQCKFCGSFSPCHLYFCFFFFIFFAFSFFCRKLNSVQTLPALLLQWSAAPTQATIWSWRLLLVKLLISIRISSNLITFDWFWSPFWSLTSDQHQHQHQYQDSLKSDNFSLIRPGMTATHYLSHGPRLRQEAGTFKSCRWVCSPFAVYFQLCTFNCQISCTAAWRPTAGCLQWFTGAFNPPYHLSPLLET